MLLAAYAGAYLPRAAGDADTRGSGPRPWLTGAGNIRGRARSKGDDIDATMTSFPIRANTTPGGSQTDTVHYDLASIQNILFGPLLQEQS